MTMQQICIFLMVVIYLVIMFLEVQKRTTVSKVEKYLSTGEYDRCLALLGGPVAHLMYARYNRLFMLLNVYLAKGDDALAKSTIDEMLALKLSNEQELALAIKAFAHFVDIEDKDAAHSMLSLIEKDGPGKVAVVSRQTYEIFLCGSSRYVDEMEKELVSAQGIERARLCQLLAAQYESRGNRELSERYRGQAQTEMEKAYGAQGSSAGHVQ